MKWGGRWRVLVRFLGSTSTTTDFFSFFWPFWNSFWFKWQHSRGFIRLLSHVQFSLHNWSWLWLLWLKSFPVHSLMAVAKIITYNKTTIRQSLIDLKTLPNPCSRPSSSISFLNCLFPFYCLRSARYNSLWYHQHRRSCRPCECSLLTAAANPFLVWFFTVL